MALAVTWLHIYGLNAMPWATMDGRSVSLLPGKPRSPFKLLAAHDDRLSTLQDQSLRLHALLDTSGDA